MMLFSVIFGIYALPATAFVLNRPIREFYLNADDPACTGGPDDQIQGLIP